jgi:hypothetical protein
MGRDWMCRILGQRWRGRVCTYSGACGRNAASDWTVAFAAPLCSSLLATAALAGSLFLRVLAVRSALASDDLSADDELLDEADDDEPPFLTAFKCSRILVCLCFLGGAAVLFIALLAAGIVMK